MYIDIPQKNSPVIRLKNNNYGRTNERVKLKIK